MQQVKQPFVQITDLDGSPLQNGNLYFGTPNLNPETNPIAVYWDAAATQPAAQPIKTSNGYPVRNGTIADLYAPNNYSLVARDRKGSLIFYKQNVDNDASLVGTSPAPGGLWTSVQGFIDVLISTVGPTVLNFLSPLTGAILRTLQSKLNDSVSVKDFGSDNSGLSGTSAAIQAAINSGAGDIYIPDGTYLIDADLIVPDNVCIYFSKKAVFKASANGRTFFKSTTHAYFSQIHNAQLDGNGKTGVIGFNMTNMRLNAGIFNPFMHLMDTGFVGQDGCFGLLISNPTAYGVTNPIVFVKNNSGTVVDCPNFDNSAVAGGNGLGSGVTIQNGAGSNLGAIVRGGYIQGFNYGIDDGAIGTIVDSVYFEACVTADITANTTARNNHYKNIGHWGGSGAAGYVFRNTDSITVEFPTMGSGARTKLFDVDGTNTNCRGFVANSQASYNSPIGTITGILLSNYNVGFTVTDGSGAGLAFTQNAQAYWSASGNVVTVTADITYPATASGAFASITLPRPGKAGTPINAAVGYTSYGAPLLLNGVGATVGILLASSSGNLQNVNMSGKRLGFTFSYIAEV